MTSSDIITWNFTLPENFEPVDQFLLSLKAQLDATAGKETPSKLHAILDGRDVFRVSMQNRFKLDNEQLTQFRASFGAGSLDDSETLEIIKKVYLEYKEIIDPHTAVAMGIQFKNKYEQSVILSTAHPAKFPDTVDKAIGEYPQLPIANVNIYKQEERIISKNNKLNEIKEYILNNYGK